MDDLSLIQLSGYDFISHGRNNKGELITHIDLQFSYELNMKLNTYKHWEGQSKCRRFTTDDHFRKYLPTSKAIK